MDVILAFALYGLIPLSFALFEACFKTMYGDYDERHTSLVLKGEH